MPYVLHGQFYSLVSNRTSLVRYWIFQPRSCRISTPSLSSLWDLNCSTFFLVLIYVSLLSKSRKHCTRERKRVVEWSTANVHALQVFLHLSDQIRCSSYRLAQTHIFDVIFILIHLYVVKIINRNEIYFCTQVLTRAKLPLFHQTSQVNVVYGGRISHQFNEFLNCLFLFLAQIARFCCLGLIQKFSFHDVGTYTSFCIQSSVEGFISSARSTHIFSCGNQKEYALDLVRVGSVRFQRTDAIALNIDNLALMTNPAVPQCSIGQ